MDYDKDVFNITDGFDNEDVKINPDFYIHTGIISAQKSILLSTMDGKVSDGINAYMIFVKQIQMIAESAGYIKTAESIERIKEVNSKPTNNLGEKANKSSEILGNPKKLSFEESK